MESLLATLNQAMQGAWPIAVAAALLWGIASVLLSPCHLSTIPLVIGFVSGGVATTARGHGTRLSVAFALGMFLGIALVGVLVIGAGLVLFGNAAYASYLLATILLLAGLDLTGLLPLPLRSLDARRFERKGLGAAFVVGLVFSLGLSPCTFAFLAPILGLAAGTATRSPALGYLLVLVFGLGHCGVIAAVGGSAELVQRYLSWSNRSRALVVIKVACGICLIGGASYLVYAA